MRCSVCHQDYKQSDIIDNYFVKDTTEATSTSDEKAAQVCHTSELNNLTESEDYAVWLDSVHLYPQRFAPLFWRAQSKYEY